MKRYLLPLLLLLLLVAAAANTAFGTYTAKAQTISPSCLTISSNLSLGSRGTAVTQLQDYLRTNGFLDVASTGYFGQLTVVAVKDFQTFYGLPPVGAVGPLTRAVVQVASCQPLQVPAAPTPAASSTSATSTSMTVASTTTATSTVPSLPYSSQSFSDWQIAWGSASTTATGALRLQGSLTNNGAEAIYPKSMDWTDYRYQADVSVANGNISLIGRYVDANNFLACSFAKNWVEIDQVYNGSSTVLVAKSLDGILPGTSGLTQTTSVAMDVKGNTVGCAGYGPIDNVTYTLSPGSPMAGGIGIESWYETPLADQLDLTSVKVDPL